MLYLTSHYDLFADAFFIVDDRLMFASLHGRDSNILALQAGLSTPVHQGGINRLGFRLPESEQLYPRFTTAERFSDLSKRTTKYMTHNFGMLTHLFLYPSEVTEPNRDAQTAWITQDDLALNLDKAIWQCVEHLSSIPLQDKWQTYILSMLTQKQCIQRYLPSDTPNINAVIHGIQAAYITLPDDFDQEITQALRLGLIQP